jgi:hypothetical protein
VSYCLTEYDKTVINVATVDDNMITPLSDAVGSKITKVLLDPIVQVAIERGKRPVPFRTRKLSLSSLMILTLSGLEN